MARSRNIKPGLYKNEDLAECSIMARYIFPGMWMLADREGRMEDRPKRIKGELLPYDNADVDALLEELVRFGFILRYEVDGARFIQVLKFAEHQTPHIREVASTIPAPTEASASTNLGTCEASPRSPDVLIPDVLIPDSLSSDSLIPDTEEKPTVEDKPPTDRTEKAQVVEVFDYWRQVMGHKTSKLDAKREKAIRARLKNGYTVGNLCTAIDGCKLDPWSQGANDRNTVFDDIELICRDGPKVDKFIAIAGRGQKTARPANTQGTFDTLKRYVEKNGEN